MEKCAAYIFLRSTNNHRFAYELRSEIITAGCVQCEYWILDARVASITDQMYTKWKQQHSRVVQPIR